MDFTTHDDLRIVKIAKTDTPLSSDAVELKQAYKQNNLPEESTEPDAKARPLADARSERMFNIAREPDPRTETSQNLLVISDVNLTKDLKLSSWSHVVEWNEKLFLNRKLSDIAARTPFIWLNISSSACRDYVMRNVSDSMHNILLAYSNSINDTWVQQLHSANPDAVMIKVSKLKNFDSLSSDEILEQLLGKLVKITKPDSRMRRVAKFLFGCFIKKQETI